MASSLAALGLQNLPLLSILGSISLEVEVSVGEELQTASPTVRAYGRRRHVLSRWENFGKEEEDKGGFLRGLEIKLMWVLGYILDNRNAEEEEEEEATTVPAASILAN